MRAILSRGSGTPTWQRSARLPGLFGQQGLGFSPEQKWIRRPACKSHIRSRRCRSLSAPPQMSAGKALRLVLCVCVSIRTVLLLHLKLLHLNYVAQLSARVLEVRAEIVRRFGAALGQLNAQNVCHLALRRLSVGNRRFLALNVSCCC